MLFLFTGLLILSLGSNSLPQTSQTTQPVPTEYDNLQSIYQSLEYNTIAFNDLKQKWIIADPILIREI